ncbi:MAG: trypsin-like peptidase domain-containing protein [Ignavibacteriaceae bacterium]|nr:trypsin-like peptidase domain-containing protein [Ignavibacteriaceae bacterium]
MKLKEFQKIETSEDLAKIFGMSYKELSKIIYKLPFEYRYTYFEISKKNGTKRLISKPNKKLKQIQNKLSETLYSIYKPRPSVHGFVKQRSVISGAEKHLNKQSILNIDLENFFDSIHYGRIKYLFMAHPFNCNETIATILAHIFCHENKLPQGASSSPILTNMICYKLDKELQNLAKHCNATYTRYADDITFSFTTNKKKISKQIVEDTEVLTISPVLQQIIENNGFKINYNKVHLYKKNQRMLVTGIKVNEFTNVQRKYISKIRSMLYSWEEHGYINAKKEFESKYLTERHRVFSSLPEYRNVIRGKLNYLKMVRSKRDVLYIKYAKWFNKLVDEFSEPHLEYLEITPEEKLLMQSVLVIEILYDNSEGECVCNQGTGFYLKDVGIVTCAHVVTDDKNNPLDNIDVFRYDKITEKFRCTIQKIDSILDLAILQPVDPESLKDIQPLEQSSETIDSLHTVKMIGYPAYKIGQTPYIVDAKIASIYCQSTINKFEIDSLIREGNSGGPILNSNNKVVGIAAEGAEKSGGNNAVLRIDMLERIKS